MSQDDGEPEWFTYRTALALGESKSRVDARFSGASILIFSAVLIIIVLAALAVRG
jgi:hypothetical protein